MMQEQSTEPLATGLRGFKVRETVIPILKRYGLPWSAVIKKRRYPQILTVRCEVMFALREQGMSLCQIADICGFHHTTVMHSIKKHQRKNNE